MGCLHTVSQNLSLKVFLLLQSFMGLTVLKKGLYSLKLKTKALNSYSHVGHGIPTKECKDD